MGKIERGKNKGGGEMTLLQTIIPIFYDSHAGPIEGIYILATAIAIEFCLLLWFAISFFRSHHSKIKERLFYDVYSDFPNIPTAYMIGFNGLVLFLFLVVLITKLLK